MMLLLLLGRMMHDDGDQDSPNKSTDMRSREISKRDATVHLEREMLEPSRGIDVARRDA